MLDRTRSKQHDVIDRGRPRKDLLEACQLRGGRCLSRTHREYRNVQDVGCLLGQLPARILKPACQNKESGTIVGAQALCRCDEISVVARRFETKAQFTRPRQIVC